MLQILLCLLPSRAYLPQVLASKILFLIGRLEERAIQIENNTYRFNGREKAFQGFSGISPI
jgi:hypothetical protein